MLTRNNSIRNRLRQRPVLSQANTNDSNSSHQSNLEMGASKSASKSPSLRKSTPISNNISSPSQNNDSRISSPSTIKKSLETTSGTTTATITTKSLSIKQSPDSLKNKEISNNSRNRPKPLRERLRNSQRIKLLETKKTIVIDREPKALSINRVRMQAADLCAKDDPIYERNKLLFMLSLGLMPKISLKTKVSDKGHENMSVQQKLHEGPSIMLERLPDSLDKQTIQKLLERKVIRRYRNGRRVKPSPQSLMRSSYMAKLRQLAESIAWNNKAKVCAVRRTGDKLAAKEAYEVKIPTFTLYTSTKKATNSDDILCIDLTCEPTNDTFFADVRQRLSLCDTVVHAIC